jgi:hypothetical protein
VFQTKKVKKLNQNIFPPFRCALKSIIVSSAIKSGTKPIRTKGAVNGMGGQANQRINALERARKMFFFNL